MTTETEFRSSYESITASYRNVMRQIEEAISHEEHEHLEAAISAYESCILLVDEIFEIPVGIPEDFDVVQAEWNDACSIIQKLKGAKTEMTYRLKVLRARNATVDVAAIEASENDSPNDTTEPPTKKKSVLLDNPATHYDINTACGTPKTYKQIINGLRDVIATKDSGVQFDTLFQSQIKLYKIQPNGVVSTVGETPMSLVMCTVGGKWKFLNTICFLQCPLSTTTNLTTETETAETENMIWIYPLVPVVINCYRTDYGAFIFPDLESNIPGTAFGIMLVEQTISTDNKVELSDLEQFFLDLLEAILAGTIEKLQQPSSVRTPRDTSQQVSQHIVNAADFIARNLIKGAEKTGELMVKSTPYIISKLKPAPPDAPPMSTTVQTSVEVAKNVTSVAAGVTSWVAGKVGSASLAIGRYLAPHVQTHGATLLQKGFGYDSTEANSKMEGALTIAAGAVKGFSTIYNSLEDSAKILGNNISDNSVKIIEHTYGPSAGNVAAGTFDTIGNAFNVSRNVNYITPKGIAKKMAKNTGKAVIDDYRKNINQESLFIPAGSIYPDLRSLKDK